VHEADGVRGRQPAPGLHEHAQHLGPRARLFAQPGRQRDAVDELHRDEQPLAVHADVVDGDDVRMRQLRHRLGFAD
jgi:hypothetical protein